MKPQHFRDGFKGSLILVCPVRADAIHFENISLCSCVIIIIGHLKRLWGGLVIQNEINSLLYFLADQCFSFHCQYLICFNASFLLLNLAHRPKQEAIPFGDVFRLFMNPSFTLRWKENLDPQFLEISHSSFLVAELGRQLKTAFFALHSQKVGIYFSTAGVLLFLLNYSAFSLAFLHTSSCLNYALFF